MLCSIRRKNNPKILGAVELCPVAVLDEALDAGARVARVRSMVTMYWKGRGKDSGEFEIKEANRQGRCIGASTMAAEPPRSL